MIVHLTGSKWDMGDDLPFMRAAARAIHENGAVVARDWVELAYHQALQKTIEDESDHNTIMAENISALDRADVVIVEATKFTFTQGFQTALALQRKKPVLVVSRNPVKSHTILAYDNKLLKSAQYKTEKQLEKIVAAFIQANEISTKDLRFNFFIDRQIYNYLRSMSYETGKTKSQIIRGLIEREIRNKND